MRLQLHTRGHRYRSGRVPFEGQLEGKAQSVWRATECTVSLEGSGRLVAQVDLVFDNVLLWTKRDVWRCIKV